MRCCSTPPPPFDQRTGDRRGSGSKVNDCGLGSLRTAGSRGKAQGLSALQGPEAWHVQEWDRVWTPDRSPRLVICRWSSGSHDEGPPSQAAESGRDGGTDLDANQ
ncbi:large ribosomal subunit protein mL52 isoform X2 [Narcine bancroftii]|uniref:large ribosomal subunit protein mL52 isoform X2 n=1 Tax=Narcine bancroftii TaxID=1343680 RepID=UPI003831228D